MPMFFKTVLILVSLFLTLAPQLVFAHKVSSANVVLRISTENSRHFQVEIQTEVESSGDEALDDEIGPIDAARLFVEDSLYVLIDEQEQPKEFTAELVDESDSDTPEELKRLSVLVTWKGEIPEDGKELSLFLDETSELQVVLVTEKNGAIKRRWEVIYAGEYSRAENVEPLIKGNPFKLAEDEKNSDKTNDPNKPKAGLTSTAFTSGIAACLYNMAVALVLLLSSLLLSQHFKHGIIILALAIIFQTIGILATNVGILPKLTASSLIVGFVILVLNIDNVVSSQFRVWRYVATALGALCLGNFLAQKGPFLGLANNNQDHIVFVLGMILCQLAFTTIVAFVIKMWREHSSFKSFGLIPCSIILAGVAIFLMIENL